MPEVTALEYLEPRPGSSIRQPFVKGRNIWAEVLYQETVGEDARTPEQVAADFEVPLGAVREAIDYCVRNEPFLQAEREREVELSRAYYQKHPPLQPPWLRPSE